jgi:ABC-type nitrate/sulfonate/bicarbonate transport system permease component
VGQRRHKLYVYGIRLLAVAIVVATWQYMRGPGDVSPLVLPAMGEVASELVRISTSTTIYEAAAVTMAEILATIVIAGTLGFGIGFWGARSDARAAVLEPLLIWAYLVPMILLYPLFVLWLGVGVQSKIAFATVASFPPIAFNCLRGFRRVEQRYIDVGRAFGASPAQLDWTIKLRAGLPMAAAGLKVGAALSMVTVIVAEMLASSQGLGHLISVYSASFLTARMYAIIVVVLVIVGIFQFAVRKLLSEDRFVG